MKEYIVTEHPDFPYGEPKPQELIRCRDCKHRMHDKTCIKVMKRKPDYGFCDEGERNE